MQPVYLDHNATTPLRAEVLNAMLPYLRTLFGNPSSVHWAGRQAKHGLEEAREHVARFLHCRPSEIVFTSGGTESNNLALQGVLHTEQRLHPHVVTTTIEHSSVLEPLQSLTRHGVEVSLLPVDTEGRISVDDVVAALRPDTALVSIGLANHEIGTIQPIEKFSRITRERGIPLHVDAVQAAGKLPLDVTALGVDLLSLSAHKINGPKGIGALYIRKGTALKAQQLGGPQERTKRAGTENVAAAVGFGVAALLAGQELETNVVRYQHFTTRLRAAILHDIPGTFLNSPEHGCLPNTVNVGFTNATGEGLMMGLDLAGVAVSTGSACAAGSLEPSHVLLALGRDDNAAKSALRFSVGKDTTDQDIDYVLAVLPRIVERVRQAGVKN
ncbi:MAG: cysteine desulfurase family protein [Candidatus Binatia bacterium]